MFAVTVIFVVKEEYVEEFETVMKSQAINSLTREPGCQQFDVCFDCTDRRRVFLYELYTDRAAFDEHLKTEHFLDFDTRVKNWLLSKTAENWEHWSTPH
jgi:autoinducer 2-degrading protein